MAGADEYPDDDEFDDYNPHPYSGGYDISATYGSPLPPSPSTCYPISTPTRAAVPAPAPAPTAPPPPSPSPAPVPATPPLPSSPAQPQSVLPEPRKPPPPPVAEPYYWPEPYDYGDAPRDQPMYATPEVFRGWPYMAGAQCYSPCGRDYWRQCMRGLDYLFGHADGYGERRIGADCHGLPVYANRKGGVEDAVVVEVTPPAVGNVEWHDAGEEPDQSNLLSWYDNAKEDTYTYAQPTYGSYDTAYAQPYSLHGVSEEPSWFPNQSYQEVYKEEECQDQEFLSSYDAESKISAQPIYCYNQHFGEQPLHVQVEPLETVNSHKLEYYENFSTYNNHNDIDNLEMSRHSYEIQRYAHIPDDPLEPYKPSWSMNLGYYQSCTEGVASEYNDHTLASGEYRDMANLFVSSFFPQQTQVYEHSHGDENVSVQQNWQNNWNVCSEYASQITQTASIKGDDISHLNGSFWPFGEYSTNTVQYLLL